MGSCSGVCRALILRGVAQTARTSTATSGSTECYKSTLLFWLKEHSIAQAATEEREHQLQ